MVSQKRKKQVKKNEATDGVYVIISGVALAMILSLIAGLLVILFTNSFQAFLVPEIEEFTLADNQLVLGEVWLENENQIQVKTGNRDIYGSDFYWIERKDILRRGKSLDVIVVERSSWGNFVGYLDNPEAIGVHDSVSSPLQVREVGGAEKQISADEVVKVYFPERLSFSDRLLFTVEKMWRFVSDDPRESNTEGGVFPAIFGTVLMVIVMSVIVTPLGVLTAIYLSEYARPGLVVSLVRIAVNNLAGVPSIVYGVFGMGFFVYVLGARVDQLFFSDKLPTPTFGTGGIVWASLTLALLTLPTVIVTTLEGLRAIPRSYRESSYALGATRYEVMRYTILPSLVPSILTGVILAVSRAAGEVAPLMLTGVVKMAPSLPVDGEFPYLHLERKFMHLGFHIYDVGFQSPNVEAVRPMVYSTAILLLLIVIVLNMSAIYLRNHIRRKLTAEIV
ncbi:MAG: phosphate ABC transporter permease PstA [bacterium]|nr:phosphate ABC transporter permease PstA [bacterium]